MKATSTALLMIRLLPNLSVSPSGDEIAGRRCNAPCEEKCSQQIAIAVSDPIEAQGDIGVHDEQPAIHHERRA